MTKKPKPSTFECIDAELISMSFFDLFGSISSDIARIKRDGDEQIFGHQKTILASLEMFIVLCNKWSRSRKVDADVKLIVKEKRRIARAWYTDITKRMSAERRNAWVDAPLPKITDRDLAQRWLEEGLIKSLEEVYIELTSEQRHALEGARARWRKNRPAGYKPENAWVDAPLFGVES